MSDTITIQQEIKIKIGDATITLTKEEATSLYNQLGKVLNLKESEILPYTPAVPYRPPAYPSTPIPNWREYDEMPPYRKWYGEPIMCVVGKTGPTMM